ncbi:MAG: hypothetical protein H7257_04690 [Taibaiella sp.]|nr:hypothetical protein [Taibaiella sp.]
MSTPSFDLLDVIRTIQKQIRLIIIVTVAAMAVGAVFFAVKKNKYKATAKFLVGNPLYTDRSTLFRSWETRYVDYFGGDDDIDRVTSLLNSDTVRNLIIRKCQFQDVYKADINTDNGHAYLMGIFNKNFNIKRSEYKDMEVSYIAYDSVTAANVVNTSVKVLEETYRSYFVSAKTAISTSIKDKLVQMDSAINVLTDSLATVREKYGIYSLLSPNRQLITNGESRGGGKGYGRAIEEIQNVESIKDQLVTDRSHYISMLNEFATSSNSAMEYIKVITRATPPNGPTGPSIWVVLGVAGALGLFFSVLFALIMAYYRVLDAVQR